MINSLLNRFQQLISSQQEESANAILNSLDRVVLLTDEQGDITSVHGNVQYFFPSQIQSIIGQPVTQYVPLLDEFFDQRDREDENLSDRLMTKADGERIIVDLTIRRFSSGQSNGWVILVPSRRQSSPLHQPSSLSS